MRIRNCIFWAFLLYSSAAYADVDAISLRFGMDGTLTDIQTSLTSASMALSSPIVETDGSKTDPTEDLEPTEEETDALFLTKGAEDDAEDDSSNDGGDVNCEELEGKWVEYGSQKTCCKDGKPLKKDKTGFEEYYLLPQCGCEGYSRSLNTNESGEWSCCSGHKSVATKLNGPGVDISSNDDDLCQCPETFEVDGKTWNVRDISSSSLVCCAKNYKLQPDGEKVAWTDCACSDGYSYNENGECAAVCTKDTLKNCLYKTSCEEADGQWCSLNEEPGEYCKPSGESCCGDGEKLSTDGCIPCPDEGSIVGDMCCSDGKAYVSGRWEPDPTSCECPSDSTLAKDGDDVVCCYDNNPGTFVDMDENDFNDKARAIRLCGCLSGEGIKEVEEGHFVCCDENHKITASTTTKDDLKVGAYSPKYCGCEKGEYDSGQGSCVECSTDADCKDDTKPSCDTTNHQCVCTNTSCGNDKVCDNGTCKTCEEKDSSKRHYLNGECVACTQDTDCPTGKICDPDGFTCETCVLDGAAQKPNHGCEEASTTVANVTIKQQYCINKTPSDRGCSECRNRDDCTENKPHCLKESGICSVDCGKIGVDEKTGECKCSDDTPVFDIINNRCVTCYDSIGGSWTDLGCNKVETIKVEDTAEYSSWNYSPYQEGNDGKPICKVEYDSKTFKRLSTDNGQCVQCTENAHCPSNQVCNSKNECGCPSEKPALANNKCFECDSNNSGSGDHKCSTTKPLCKSGTCTCQDNYDASKKKAGDGMCPARTPACSKGECTCQKNYDSSKKNGDGKCSSDMPMCHNGQCKKCTEVSSSTPFWNGSSCIACGTNMTYSSTEGKCICATGYCLPDGGSKCIAVTTYDDVKRGSNGSCTKKSLKGTTYTMNYVSKSVGSCEKYKTLEKMRVRDNGQSTLRLMYSHTATVRTSAVDDCTYGTFVGKFTSSGSCATLASSHGFQSGTFSETITIPAGTHSNIYIEFQDIHCGNIAGGGSIKLKD